MEKNEKSILVVSCYGHFVSHFNMLVFPGLLLPLSDHFQMDIGATLSLSFWMYALFGFSALPWGLLGYRIGPKVLLALFHLGAGFSAFSAAMFLDNPLIFSISLTFIGLFSGIYHPIGLGWIARDIKRTSVGMAYNGMSGNLGLAVAPLLAGIINYHAGPHIVYVAVAFINLAGLIFIFKTKDTDGSLQNVPQETEKGSAQFKPFFILLIAMMLGGLVYRGTSVSLPAYFELNNQQFFIYLNNFFGNIGSENVVATAFTSLIYLVGMGGQYFGGRVGEKFDLKRGYLAFHSMIVPFAFGMAYFTDLPLILLAMVHSFFLLGMQPIENTLVARLTPRKLLSSAYGLKFALTFGVGSVSVKLIDYIKNNYGISNIFVFLGVVSIILVMTILLLIFVKSDSEEIISENRA